MSEDNHEEQKPELSKAQVEKQKTIQAFQHVFGRENVTRNKHQKLVVDWLQRIVEMPTFTRGMDGKFCPIAAALNEGQRLVANQALTYVAADPLEAVEKPTVKKG